MKVSRLMLISLFAMLLFAIGTNAWAEESTGERVALKAARGVDNIVLGLAADWPKTMYYESKAHGIPYGMTVGFFQGFLTGVARTGVGVYELATFPVPVPADYQPILSPQFSLERGETRIAQ
jgi:putative exosortase-associated protein (TIGR04073 family)